VNYVTGDVLTATNLNDLAGTVNLYDPTAKGDLFPAISGTSVGLLAVGANNTVLTADSAAATGMKWAAAGGGGGGGGKVLQVVHATTETDAYNTTSTFADTGLTATITPTLNTSKILVIWMQSGVNKNNLFANTGVGIRLLRGATAVGVEIKYAAYTNSTTSLAIGTAGNTHLDSPATTSATTYKTQFKSMTNTNGVYVQDNTSGSTITLMEIGA
jgi:hypothetical protein